MSLDWLAANSPLPCPVVLASASEWLGQTIDRFTKFFPYGSFFRAGYEVRALLALVLVSVCCGAVGSLVVGGRMAFFSDALAHCAFAGFSIGFLIFDGVIVHRFPGSDPRELFWQWVTPLMAAFGVLVGLGIVAVRQRTGLASDTVIGVFFAGGIGLAAMLRHLITKRSFFRLEDFLFGDPLTVNPLDLLALAGLTVVTLVVLAWGYNFLLLGSFNTSLALSRRVPLRIANYVFVALLAVVVNLCLRSVGVLLINALLIVPAATAMNVSRNMRQLFWLTVALCLGVSIAGQALAWELAVRAHLDLGISGTIVLLSVALFLLSMIVGPLLRRPGTPEPKAMARA